ncbi:S9 family peptidase [Thalassotalea sp. LPB0316]|uniref:S9 family peptidase n=1 Tax=Thalassotalea sp. LPB0316 TaxID=2769490 RepID=UPI0018693FD8|nr:S9 family peptidase [Thalassotalea sp. LPB0316]QOL25520.1 S9 family peptidase [Thalassotalea sp. LPB0316]
MKNAVKQLAIGVSALALCFISVAEEAPKVEPQELTIDRIYSSPSLNGATPKSLRFSPDGKRVTYLQGKQEDLYRYDLWEYHIDSDENRLLVDSKDIFDGIENLSDEEKARRERQRIYGSGIMEYKFSNDGKALLFPLNGDLYYYNLAEKKAKRLTNTPAFETDAKFSPKANFVSFIRNQNIFVIDIDSGEETKLTKSGGGTIKNGMSEFVAQEEMGRMTGYWWSPDEKYIAFLNVDESPVDIAVRNEIYAEEIKLVEQRYPYTGTPNVKIKLATVNVKSQRIRTIDIGEETDIYIPRVNWLPKGDALTYQWQSRDQKTLKLNLYSVKNRRQSTLLTETSSHWLNLHDDLTFLSDNKRFIWASERDGFKHLYLYNTDGEQLAQLTKGQWVVDSLHAVDEQAGWIYFTGRADTPLERHLYKAPLDGKSPEHVVRVTKRNGFHDIVFSSDLNTYINKFSNIQTPSQVSLHKINGEHITWLEENKVDNNHPIAPYYDQLVMPEFGTLKSDDETTTLYYKIYKPKQLVPGKKYPVIVNVYGGPYAQRVTNRWQGADFTQFMVSQGYIVFQLDNRGSNYRGTAFEFPIYENLGDIEVTDQVTGVKFLRTLNYVDEQRIGIYGHSYGGYMALMSMFKAGEYFKAGVSGAPVTDWRLYDTHYTERYLNHPKANEKGYESSSVFPYAKDLNGPLFIYHGMADDNVLFTNTTKLIKTLQDENKLFELMTYPGAKHSMRGKKVKVHLNNSIIDFFDRHFKAQP